MKISFIPHTSCTGCGACENICPVSCIQMKPDYEKFLYPVIDEQACIHCGKCEEVCPVKNKVQRDDGIKPEAYALVIGDEDIRRESSSGGAFTVLADYVLDKGGVVFGVGLSEDCRVVTHMAIDNKDELFRLRGSKYVQSSIGRSYQEIKNLLECHRPVLFSGTPCQVEGLKKYLGKEYEELLTADLICHGVPSQYVWNKYLDYREKVSGATVRRTYFRHKKYGWNTYSLLLEFSNNKEYVERLDKDLYLQAFLNNACLRPCCHICSFKTVNRVSDFTMADLWGIKDLCPEWDDNKGVSLLLIHSEKGRQVFKQMSSICKVKKISLRDAIAYNNMAIESLQPHSKREQFIHNVDSMDFDKLVRKYGMPPFSLRRQIANLLRKLGIR